MISIAKTIFGRLHVLDPTAEEARLLATEEEPQHGEISMSVPTNVNDTDKTPKTPSTPQPCMRLI